MTTYALMLAIERHETDEGLAALGFKRTTIWRMRKRWLDASAELEEMKRKKV
jgi:hypothetical protein